MKKLATLALLSILAVGLSTGHASAWWHFCCKHCSIKITCKQYNAFSPYCCDGVNGATAGACPWGGCGYGAPGAYAYGGPGGYAGELPAMNQFAGAGNVNYPPMTSAPQGGIVYPGAGLSMPQSTTPNLPNWGFASPNAVPGFHPAYTYAPTNGVAR